jgi:agmatinase
MTKTSAFAPFYGCSFAQKPNGFGAALFGASHGTPYPGIDNRIHAGTAAALRSAIAPDAEWQDHWDFDFGGELLAGSFKAADLGDLETSPLDGEGNRRLIREAATAILASGAVPVMVGGDDSTPIPFIEAFAARAPVTILQIDAHIDWRDERYGERLGFSSTMRRASEMAHVKGIVQAGARGIGSARKPEVDAALAWGAKIVTARSIHDRGVSLALDHVPEGANCIVTLDCDALDSSIMPAVSYPTPGGLTYWQIVKLIEGVATKGKIVGFDLIEFVPARDATGAAAFTAARIIANVMARLARA